MYKEVRICVLPKDALNLDLLKNQIARMLGIGSKRICRVDVVRRSIDARRKTVMMNLVLGVHIDNEESVHKEFIPLYHEVMDSEKVLIVGAGPAGLFAALRLIERGYCPVILERGKSVEERKKDLKFLYRTGEVDEDSNFGFGEGGAGTFSDGKLFSRSKKRGNLRRILEILVYHGADPRILWEAHPHVGTDKLPGVIVNIRETIKRYGGEVHFNTRVTDLLLKDNKIMGVVAGGKEFYARHLILATGHSARDVYQMLHRQNIILEPKDFAVGLRLEHPQFEIDCMQYHSSEGRGEYLPAAEYSFVTNINGRGVYSFCMCPGGVVVPAATGAQQQVVNGMSSSARNTQWANSAIVTAVGEKELQSMGYGGLFAGMEFQRDIERRAWKEGGGGLYAPVQVLTDFIAMKTGSQIPSTSYKPGICESLISGWFPSILCERLSTGIKYFDKKAPGFISSKALLLGVETRTSSPVRIPRDGNLCHPEIEGLYPCGEGAGYAGGIISAAMDGEKCADSIG